MALPREEDYLLYSPIVDRPPVKWPGDARVALWLAPNVEYYEYLPTPSRYRQQWPRTPDPDVFNYSHRDSGNRTAFWRMLELFDTHRVKATVSINVAVLEHFPEICDAMVERDWDFMSHGVYNTRYLMGMAEEEEREFYRYTSSVIRQRTEKELKGMLGPSFTATPNTPNLMAEAGLIYQVDWFVDDQPFPLRVRSGKLCGVPYSRMLNDAMLFNAKPFEADYFAQICRDQFDVLYEEGAESGRVMCIALHPYLMGQAHRIKYLDDVLTYILSHDGVWATTADQIAEWYLGHHYDEHLEYLLGKTARSA